MQADREKIVRLLKTARGQIDGILKMVEENRYCIDISNQITASRAVLSKANIEVLSAHLKNCVATSFENGDSQQKLQEISAVLEKLL